MITHDIQRFSTHLAAIYSNLAKPVLDVILYNYQLSRNVGAEGLFGLTVSVQLTASLCQWILLCILTFSLILQQCATSHRLLVYIPLFLLNWLAR